MLLGPVAGSSAPLRSVATSQAFGIRIAIPGQAAITQGYVSAPNDASATLGGYAYPDDGSVLTSGAMTLSATSASTSTHGATASVEVNGITHFGGEVTIALLAA